MTAPMPPGDQPHWQPSPPPAQPSPPPGYGPPPPPGYSPPPGGFPAPGGRPPRRLGLRILSVVTVLVIIVAGLVIRGVIKWALDRDPEPPRAPASFTVGGCVRITTQPSVVHSAPGGPVLRAPAQYGAVECGDRTAYAKITKMAPGQSAFGPQNRPWSEDAGCPEDSDEIANVKSNIGLQTQIACLRNLKPPHPGDPGQGGGVVRSGDCLQLADTYTANVREVACTTRDWTVDGVTFGKEWFGQVVGRADTVRGCSSPAIYTITIESRVRPVLCLAKNGGWLPAAGDCVDTNLFVRASVRRKCSDRFLALKITALVPAGRGCPGGISPRTVPGYIPRVCSRPAS